MTHDPGRMLELAGREAAIALIQGRDGADFDGEVHLTTEEGRQIIAALSASPASDGDLGERIAELERQEADREARDEIISALAGGIEAIDGAADKWVSLAEVRRSSQAIASVFAKYASDDIMTRFIERLVAIQHLAFAEGFYAAYEAASSVVHDDRRGG